MTTKPLNMRTARDLAKEKLGIFASVRIDRYGRNNPYWVGKTVKGSFVIFGSGMSWEKAFEDLSKRSTK